MTDDERTNGLVSPAQTDTEPVSETVPNLCDDETHEPGESAFYVDLGWHYCPRCGVKL